MLTKIGLKCSYPIWLQWALLMHFCKQINKDTYSFYAAINISRAWTCLLHLRKTILMEHWIPHSVEKVSQYITREDGWIEGWSEQGGWCLERERERFIETIEEPECHVKTKRR